MFSANENKPTASPCAFRNQASVAARRAVQRSGGAGLTLHFHDVRDRAPDVDFPLRRPLVGPFTHGGRRRDGINGDDFINLVGDIGCRFVAINGDLGPEIHGYFQ